MKTRGVLSLVVCLLAFLVLGEETPALSAPGQPEALARDSMQAALLQTPLAFEINRGQTAAQVKYLSRGSGHTLFLTSDEVVLALRREQQTLSDSRAPSSGTVLRMRLVGANHASQVEEMEPLPGKTNYFIGNDRTKWRTNIPTYAKIKYKAIYPGVDLVYYGTNQRQLEYDFVVAPGANPKAIRFAFSGVDRLSLDARGDLILRATGREIVQRAPKVYQEINGVRQAVTGGYVLHGKNQVGFRVAGYDRTRPLVIDPTLSLPYSTYLGGNGFDQGFGIAVDSSGNAYVTGATISVNFPMAANSYSGGTSDTFVAKLTFTGSPPVLALAYATYLGGSGFDQGVAIAVDGSGNAYATGSTQSVNFPTTSGTFDTTFGGGGNFDAFVTKLDVGGGLLYSTYLGGSNSDEGTAIVADNLGNAYVAGRTASPSSNFPIAVVHFVGPGGGLDAFVTKLDPAGSTLLYFTYIGGGSLDEGLGIAVDSSGNAYVTGDTSSPDFLAMTIVGPGGGLDAFVTKLDPAGSTLLYSTRLGGSSSDQGFGIAVDSSGNAYVTGSTASSSNFPLASALQPTFGGSTDAFVAKLNPAGSALVYSTYLGGSSSDQGFGIAVDSSGNAYVTGSTSSTNFPTVNTLPSSAGINDGTGGDAFVAKLDPAGAALVYSTYLGGNNFDFSTDIAVDSSGNAYVTGLTFSSNFLLANSLARDPTNGINVGFGGDAFVAKLDGIVSGIFTATVTVAGTGTGTVTSSPTGITCPGVCAAPFTSGSFVTLTAAPTGGSTVSWGGDCTASGSATTCTLTMDANKSVTVTFSAPMTTLTVSVAGTGTGTVTSSPTGITCPGVCAAPFTSGSFVTLTAAPTGGSTVSWGGDCTASGSATTCTLTMDAGKSVTVTFDAAGGGGESSCNMVGHVHGNQKYKAIVSGKKVNVQVEVDGDCDLDKKTNRILLHHAKVHIVVGGGPPLINAEQNDSGKHNDVKSVTLSPGPPPASGTPTAIVEGVYNTIPFKVVLTDGGKEDKGSDHDKGNKNDTVVVVTPVLPTPITGDVPQDSVQIDWR